MSVTTLYFDSGAYGVGDGSTWGNRAALLSGTTWSPYITSFNYSGAGLQCMVGPASYAVQSILQASIFTGAPSSTSPLIFVGCDSTGAPIGPPKTIWTSDMPSYDDSSYPSLSGLGITQIANLSNTFWCYLNFASSSTATYLVQNGTYLWSTFNLSQGGSSTRAAATATMHSCVARVLIPQWDNIVNQTTAHNCRFEGNPLATAGNRQGVVNMNSNVVEHCTILNTTLGIQTVGTSYIHNCVINRTSGNGISIGSSATTVITNTVISNSSGNGISSAGRGYIYNLRTRGNISGDIAGLTNFPSDMGIVSGAATDISEYANPIIGDYRMLPKSTAAQRNIGVSKLHEVSRTFQS